MYEFGSAITQGKRPYQEDYCEFILANGHPGANGDNGRPAQTSRLVAALADGMGGHVGGAVASQTAVAGFKANYSANSDAPAGQRLHQALLAGNAALAERRQQDPSLEGMGCTFIGALFEDPGIRWISVGDSLIYLYRNGQLSRLNEDHSMAPELDRMAARNEITVEQAQADPMRHALRSAIMGDEPTLIDHHAEPLALMAGDWVIIASDGIDTLGTTQIRASIESVGKDGAQAVANHLIGAVEAAGRPRQDNTTIMVVRIPGPAAKPVARGSTGAQSSRSGGIGHLNTDTLKALGIAGVFTVMLLVAIASFRHGDGDVEGNANPSQSPSEISGVEPEEEESEERGTTEEEEKSEVQGDEDVGNDEQLLQPNSDNQRAGN
jgi:protein phosphatase